MQGTHVPPLITPVQFALDVLLLRVGWRLTSHYVEAVRFPMGASMLVRDWAEFLPILVSPHDLVFGPENLRSLLLRDVEAQLMSSDVSCEFNYLAQGILSPVTGQHPLNRPPLTPETFMQTLCGCMNQASNLHSWLRAAVLNPNDVHAAFYLLGSNLAGLCRDHALLVELFKTSGAALESRDSGRDAALDQTRAVHVPCAAPPHPCGDGGGGRPRRRAAQQGHDGLPIAVPLPGEGCETPGGAPGSPEGSDLSFLSSFEGDWRQGHLWPDGDCGRLAGARRKHGC